MGEQDGQWWGPGMKDSWGTSPRAPADGGDAATSAWTADLCDKTLGKEPSREDEQKYAPLEQAAQERETAAWKEYDVSRPDVQ